MEAVTAMKHELVLRLRRLSDIIDVSSRTAERSLGSFTFLVYVFLYFPIFLIIILSFTPRNIAAFPMRGFSLQWYHQLIPPDYNENIVNALILSIKLGVVTAVISGILGTMAALGMVRNQFKSRFLQYKTLLIIIIAPITVPWIVTGIAVLVFYTFLGIRGSFYSLLIGHILITLPFVVLVVSAQVHGFDRSVEEAAKNLGASELRTFYEVTLPLISTAVFAGILFAFTISFINFTQTFFWTSVQTETLPVVIYGMIRTGFTPIINAIGTVIIVVSVAVAVFAELLSRRLTTEEDTS